VPLAKLTLGYDGTDFFGSQSQIQGRTVQSELERAMRAITGTDVRLAFAGRTDRGVHAVGQVASGEVPWRGTPHQLRKSLNAVSSPDVIVSSVDWAADDFHARFSARWREYRYRVVVDEVQPVLSQRTTWWRQQQIDAEIANAACRKMVGAHSFGSFASGGWSQSLSREQLERTVYQCEWVETRATESPTGAYGELRIVANGFMPQMVRNITGAVVEVASGLRPVSWIEELLTAGDRRLMGAGAPPHGLILWQVGYTEYDNGSQA
jgi:tRNA pseudouridine38-40 synthase